MRIFRFCCLLIGFFLIQASDVRSSIEMARSLDQAFASVYEKVSPSVVVIEVQRTPGDETILPNGWEFFFRTPPGGESDAPSQGSGLIVSSDGYIVTNYHVIAPAAEDGITVILKDGRRFPAQVVGTDAKTDLAVLQVKADGLPAALLGDSDAVRVGQFAFALGAPMELPYTFTFGLISATGRTNLTRSTAYENYLQTDAAINPGNSGGPLADIEGRVIGINTLISGLNRGLGFAIPINMVKDIAAQLIAAGEVIRPWLGISIEGISESERLRRQFPSVEGVVVQAIFADTPASKSALRAGDVIQRVDGKEVRRAGDVQQAVLRRAVGDEVTLDVWRSGQQSVIRLRAGRQPGDLRAASRAPASQSSPSPLSDSMLPPQNPAPGGISGNNTHIGAVLKPVDPDLLKSWEVTDRTAGLLVLSVEPGSVAEVAGLEPGDVILEAGNQPVASVSALEEILREADLSRGIMLSIAREGSRTFAIIKQ